MLLWLFISAFNFAPVLLSLEEKPQSAPDFALQ